MDEFPQGTNAVVAVISYTGKALEGLMSLGYVWARSDRAGAHVRPGYDMEDAMIINKASYDRGFGAADVYKTKSVSLKKDHRGAKRPQLRFSNTRTAAVAGKRQYGGPVGGALFQGLEADGLPVVGSWVKEGDPLYAAVDRCVEGTTSGRLELGQLT